MAQELHQQCQRIKEMHMEARDRICAGLRPLHLCIKTVSSLHKRDVMLLVHICVCTDVCAKHGSMPEVCVV